MSINIEKLLPEELKQLIEILKSKIADKENSTSTIALLVNKDRQEVKCPRCHSNHIKKNGIYKGKQLYKCKECNKKFNELTNTPFHHTRLTYTQISEAYDCLINKLSIRKTASKLNVSTKTAFVLRFKIICCLKQIVNNNMLEEKAQLDEYYLSINLKGTKKQNMARISKKRKRNGSRKSGITKHMLCITSGVDSNDNMIFKIAGTSNASSEMIDNSIGKFIKEDTDVITDMKSSYIKVASKNKWNLTQIKSKAHVDENGSSLSSINALHHELSLFLSNFRGVSTKHLQEYLDWFVFIKWLNYHKNYNEQAKTFEDKTVILNSYIKYSNVYCNYSGIDFTEVYKDYNYQPPKCTT